jgi:predicted nucleotidyltransferase
MPSGSAAGRRAGAHAHVPAGAAQQRQDAAIGAEVRAFREPGELCGRATLGSGQRILLTVRKTLHCTQLKALSQAAAAELAEDPNSNWQHPALFDDPAWPAFQQHADMLLDSLYQQSISDVEARRAYVETIRAQVEKRLRTRYRTTQVHIFGSSLMGLETALSDVDFMADIRGVMPPDTDIQEAQARIEEVEANLPDFVQLRAAVHDWKRKLVSFRDVSTR